ncbi:hypothetical protein DFA_03721 [Cavenderia fasciculata]|uniref:DUF6748 domain-containing protein n=1 Tax=Cavenderia fasciculata TaxID=261658 RepID=F4Q083_CACFS|nr:uncharacterized protein DFA_03721 [Cavenderia fasciculata]EGG18234.1 hypothetical protein DFA_03721 [Cavenderia fasciculata]|eukprot:XP_004357057.1 hypothetical protein DFA_03721 [Cavenderia fasciculata]
MSCDNETNRQDFYTSIDADIALGGKKPTSCFVSIRRDFRKCAYPMCGGYFIQTINSNSEQVYVATVAFESNQPINKSVVLESYGKSVIVNGYTRSSSQRGYKEFVVKTAHVSMEYEGIGEAKGNFYFFKSTGIMCIKAPCPSTSATELNTGNSVIVSSFSEPYNEHVHRFDGSWAISRVYDEDGSGHAIVQMVPNQQASEFTITRIYIQVPDPIKPCPKVTRKCPKGQVDLFDRDTNRCLVFRECAKPGVCILSIPLCQEKWRLHSYPSLQNGCNNYYCDPDFTTPAQQIK